MASTAPHRLVPGNRHHPAVRNRVRVVGGMVYGCSGTVVSDDGKVGPCGWMTFGGGVAAAARAHAAHVEDLREAVTARAV